MRLYVLFGLMLCCFMSTTMPRVRPGHDQRAVFKQDQGATCSNPTPVNLVVSLETTPKYNFGFRNQAKRETRT
jgi:hypothetical protein